MVNLKNRSEGVKAKKEGVHQGSTLLIMIKAFQANVNTDQTDMLHSLNIYSKLS